MFNTRILNISKQKRKGWKIENEGFNISHLCSRNENVLKIHYYFIQTDYTIR